jgi:hypothetical protein
LGFGGGQQTSTETRHRDNRDVDRPTAHPEPVEG